MSRKSKSSVIDAPVIDAPVIDAPVIDAPVIDAPVIDAPVIDAPVIPTIGHVLMAWLYAMLPTFTGILGAPRSYTVAIFARNPDRIGYGKGNNVVECNLETFASVPSKGDSMVLCATDTEISGYTLHLKGPCSVGYKYLVPGFGTWTVRTSQMPMAYAGGTYPPAMLLCSVPLMAAGQVRGTALVSRVPLVSPRGLTLAVEVQAPEVQAPEVQS